MIHRSHVRLGKLILGTALLMLLGCGLASAQSPNAIKAFQASNGGAVATWAAGPNNSSEATWVKEGQKMVYCYDATGVLQQKKIISTIGAFPAGVNSSILAAYPQGKVQYAYKVVDRTNQKYYEVEVANASAVDRMRFSLEGKPIGKTSIAAAKPVATQPAITQPMASAQPTAKVVAPAPAPKPVAVAPATKPVAVAPATKPVAVAPSPKPSSPPVAMRGENATTVKTAPVKNDDLIDDDLGDLLEDEDMDDLFKDDENWDDINLDDPVDDDSDLLDGTDDLDLDDDFDLDEMDDDGL